VRVAPDTHLITQREFGWYADCRIYGHGLAPFSAERGNAPSPRKVRTQAKTGRVSEFSWLSRLVDLEDDRGDGSLPFREVGGRERIESQHDLRVMIAAERVLEAKGVGADQSQEALAVAMSISKAT